MHGNELTKKYCKPLGVWWVVVVAVAADVKRQLANIWLYLVFSWPYQTLAISKVFWFVVLQHVLTRKMCGKKPWLFDVLYKQLVMSNI